MSVKVGQIVLILILQRKRDLLKSVDCWKGLKRATTMAELLLKAEKVGNYNVSQDFQVLQAFAASSLAKAEKLKLKGKLLKLGRRLATEICRRIQGA